MPRTNLGRNIANEKIVALIWGTAAAAGLTTEELGAKAKISRSRIYARKNKPEDLTLRELRSIGRALQYWVLANAQTRRIANLRDIDILWTLPVREPECRETIRRLVLPESLPEAGAWTVTPEEIDDNGHLNNVVYVQHAQRFAPPDTKWIEVIYDRECFLGETLRLFAKDGCVRGVKSDGSESFRARFQQSEEESR